MSEPDKDNFDLVAAQAAYETARLEEPLIRDIEHEFGEAINGHRNARRALMAVYMRGFLDGASDTTQKVLEQLRDEKIGADNGTTESNSNGPDESPETPEGDG